MCYRRTNCIILLLLIFLLLQSQTIWAGQNATGKKKAYELPELRVIGTQPGVKITPVKTIINMDKFKKIGGVDTVEDVLYEVGGIDVQRKNPLMASPGDQISIRGLTEGRIVVEIDGRRINHTGHYGKYIVDWSTLNVDDIKRIEIIRGGYSVLHPFAMGGVINLITKKGKKTEELKPEVGLKAGYGEYDTYSLASSFTGGIANILGYHFSAKKKETDGYHRNEFQDTVNFNGRLGFYLPREAKVILGVKYSDVEYGYPVINDPNDPDPEVAARYDSDYPIFKRSADQLRHLNYPQLPTGGDLNPEWEKHTGYYDAIFQMPLGPGSINLHGYMTDSDRWTSTYRKGADMSNPAAKFNKDNFVSDRTKGVICEYRDLNLFDSHNFTLGYDHQELGSQDDTTYVVNSGYIQDVLRLGKRWTVTAGLRYYHLDMDTFQGYWEMGYDSPPRGWPFSVDNSQEETDEGFYPSLKVDFQATKNTTIYAALSRSYRLPCP